MRRTGQMGRMPADTDKGFIPPHGGYAGLVAYQKALIVFQATCRFCERFLEKRDRTVDQMVQAARSGKQNIVEASKVSGTSKEGEIKLTKNSREALFVRSLARKQNVTYETYETYVDTRSAAVVANILICLIHQANYLLDQLIRKLEKDFLAEGGLRERMTRARLAQRATQKREAKP